jgi:hypothetical protein
MDQLEWLDFDGTTFWASIRAIKGGGMHLLVEMRPGGSWDWSVWSDTDREHCLSGITADAEAAIMAARTAAKQLSLHLVN